MVPSIPIKVKPEDVSVGVEAQNNEIHKIEQQFKAVHNGGAGRSGHRFVVIHVDLMYLKALHDDRDNSLIGSMGININWYLGGGDGFFSVFSFV